MPLDIVLFRAEGNPDSIRKSQAARGAPVEAVDEIIAKDEKWRCGRPLPHLFTCSLAILPRRLGDSLNLSPNHFSVRPLGSPQVLNWHGRRLERQAEQGPEGRCHKEEGQGAMRRAGRGNQVNR